MYKYNLPLIYSDTFYDYIFKHDYNSVSYTDYKMATYLWGEVYVKHG
jgi:hypothetical protein